MIIIYTESTEGKKIIGTHPSSKAEHNPTVLLLFLKHTEHAPFSRAWTYCSFQKFLLLWVISSPHSHLRSNRTSSERPFLVLLSKRAALFSLYPLFCLTFLHNIYHRLTLCYILFLINLPF